MPSQDNQGGTPPPAKKQCTGLTTQEPEVTTPKATHAKPAFCLPNIPPPNPPIEPLGHQSQRKKASTLYPFHGEPTTLTAVKVPGQSAPQLLPLSTSTVSSLNAINEMRTELLSELENPHTTPQQRHAVEKQLADLEKKWNFVLETDALEDEWSGVKKEGLEEKLEEVQRRYGFQPRGDRRLLDGEGEGDGDASQD